MTFDASRLLENLTAYRARAYTEALQDLLVAMARDDLKGWRAARARLAKVMAETMGTAEIVGATLALRAAAGLLAEEPQMLAGTRERMMIFAQEPAQTIIPQVTFNEAVQDMIDRAPVTIRRAAERTARRISELYTEDRVIAFVRSAEQTVTKRVQDLIVEALEKGIPEAVAGRRVVLAVEKVREATKSWTEGYARMAFRTNVNNGITAGRFRQAQDPDIAAVIPCFRFQSVMDSDTRPNHGAADELIFRTDNPVWKRIAPPLGYNCRCGVAFVSFPELRRLGRIRPDGSIIEDQLPSTAFPDPGFRVGPRPDLGLVA